MNRMTPIGAKTWLFLALAPTAVFAQTATGSVGDTKDPMATGAPGAEPVLLPALAASASTTAEPTGGPPPPNAGAPTTSGNVSNVSPSSTIRWQSPPDCPPPQQRLDELLRVPSKHPLWGSVEVSRAINQGAHGFRAHLRLSDGPSDAPHVSDRVLDGNTCAEVTEAALLIVSIMQREQQHLDAAPAPQPIPAPAAQLSAPSVEVGVGAPVLAPTPLPPPPPNPRSPEPMSAGASVEPPLPTSTTLALGAAWSLWNGQSPAVGVVAELEHRWGRVAIRPQVGFATSVNPIPTSEAVKVDFTTYDAGLRLCFNMVAGVNVCGGPTLQRITVLGNNIGEPVESSAWFPGASLAIHGSQDKAGLGLWGALGANARFKEIALDVNPVGEVATVKRLTVYAWVGPQWRWR